MKINIDTISYINITITGAYGHNSPILPREDPRAVRAKPRLQIEGHLTNDEQVRKDIIAEEMQKEKVDLESNNPHALIQESQEIDGNNDIKKGNNEEIREVPVQAQDEQKPSQDRDMRDDDIHDFANAVLPPKNQVEFYRKKSKYGIKGM